jgi:acetylornithine deacetylase/succinyl-diaminopimelate desuccinylase-like protein
MSPREIAELPEISRVSGRVAWCGSSRNENGSHNPHEDTNIEDFMLGVAVIRKVLAEAAL